MRSSPVGGAFDTTDEVLRYAELSARPTHDHPEGINGAQAVALAVLPARQGASRAERRDEISRRFSYDLKRTVDEIRRGYTFEVSCEGSVPASIIAFLDSVDYESAIHSAISLGGDADAQACTAGAVAEAFSDVPPKMLAWVALAPRCAAAADRSRVCSAIPAWPHDGADDRADRVRSA